MKKFLVFIICAILIFTSCERSAANTPDTEKSDTTAKTLLQGDVCAMWISQFDLTLMCLKDGKQRKKDEYLSRVALMMARLSGIGINAIFVQLRPNGDSLYPSQLFPSSAYAVGKCGADFDYDPIEILLNEAKRAKISAHAWINPLRLMKDLELSSLNGRYLIAKWRKSEKYYGSRVVKIGDYCYLNPAYKETRDLIVSGVCEIFDSYGFDGLHIDDYFYPTTDKNFDSSAYSEYIGSGGSLSLDDFRRENITLLVSELSDATRGRGKIFGISPAGNMQKNYNELYADVEKWCDLKLVDYLCPQIYFGLEHESFPFEKTAKSFEKICDYNGIGLIIGMTLEKAQNGYNGIGDTYAGSGRDEWINNKNILSRCFDTTLKMNCLGVSFFSYRLFYSPNDGKPVPETSDEVQALLSSIKDR